MKSKYKSIFVAIIMFTCASCLFGEATTSNTLMQISNDAEIMYAMGETNEGYGLGVITKIGAENEIYHTKQRIINPTWAYEGDILFFLSEAKGESLAGYPSYWDKKTNEIKTCSHNLSFFMTIESANNPVNPYEVIIQNAWEIFRYDIGTCKILETILDHTEESNRGTINGFSYNSKTGDIVFSENVPSGDIESTYEIKKISHDGNDGEKLAAGINPKWSPDGSLISYIGVDGLYIMDSEGGNQIKLWDHPFGEMWNWLRNTFEMGAATPCWSSDGSQLFFHVRHSSYWLLDLDNVPIFRVSVADGSVEQVATGGFYPIFIPPND